MRAVLSRAAGPMRELSRRGRTEADWLRSRRACADVAVFQRFFAPPYGGGNQFLLALVGELRRRSLTVEVNRLSGGTPACLYNSFNFDFSRLRRFARNEARMVHRVDGPIGAYRGFDDGTDRRIIEINRELADVTIVQSQFSLEKHRELGLELRDPVVIPNSVDPSIFHRPESREPLAGRRLRVIATSWSDNPRKGGEVLEWLDRNLDTDSYEFTFAGRTQRKFERIRVVQPIPSEPLADLLRSHDVYLAPSRDDPCSNALLEALACGLPAAFLRSGGHPELVGDGGIGFDGPEELPEVFARLRNELDQRRDAIRVPALVDVADRYLGVLRG
jgi:glycosyltransferase involved in cell wall biosynthesis